MQEKHQRRGSRVRGVVFWEAWLHCASHSRRTYVSEIRRFVSSGSTPTIHDAIYAKQDIAAKALNTMNLMKQLRFETKKSCSTFSCKKTKPQPSSCPRSGPPHVTEPSSKSPPPGSHSSEITEDGAMAGTLAGNLWQTHKFGQLVHGCLLNLRLLQYVQWLKLGPQYNVRHCFCGAWSYGYRFLAKSKGTAGVWQSEGFDFGIYEFLFIDIMVTGNLKLW